MPACAPFAGGRSRRLDIVRSNWLRVSVVAVRPPRYLTVRLPRAELSGGGHERNVTGRILKVRLRKISHEKRFPFPQFDLIDSLRFLNSCSERAIQD
jgi:hypothetical protein